MKKYEAGLLAPVIEALKLLIPVVSVIQKKVRGVGMTESITDVAIASQTVSEADARVRESLWSESSKHCKDKTMFVSRTRPLQRLILNFDFDFRFHFVEFVEDVDLC